jgi:serine/threonine protein kinase
MKNTTTPGAPAQPAPPADPFAGRTVGNCELTEKISEGGTAYIYRGRNTRFNLDRVVKILKPSLTGEDDFYQRFRQEAQLTARLDHPNILRVFDTGEVDGYFYMEMEFIDGQTLREYLRSMPRISEREILSIGIQLARALDYAHKAEINGPDGEVMRGILHRDIKPENVMITANKTVKLMDFGAAKPLSITSSTMQGMIVGTFHYMSPEQLTGKCLDMRSDFFSLGILLYELCIGQKPFAAENLTELIKKISSCKYHRIREIRPAITPMTEEAIDQLLARSPDHRPSSAHEIEESLQMCLQVLSSWSLGRKVRIPFSWRRAFPTVAMVVSLLALGVSVYNRQQRSPALASGQTAAPRGGVGAKAAQAAPTMSILEKAKHFEDNGQWSDAATMYEAVAPAAGGGVANEYLEAQIRLAGIALRHLKQLTRARAILESLRQTYSDPAIDVYLGEVYSAQSLYLEAKERFEAALASTTGSVISQTAEFKSLLLFNLAAAIDKQYTFIDHNPSLLIEAIKAWKYYLEFSDCQNSRSRECQKGFERLGEMQRQEQELKAKTGAVEAHP